MAVAALAFVCSYDHLMWHESGFRLALVHGLLPGDVEWTWATFFAYIAGIWV
jgi:hypothetical protein